MAEFRIPQLLPHLLFLLPGHEICSPTALPLDIRFVVPDNKSVHAVIGAPQKHASLLQIWSPLYSNFKIHIKNYCSTLTPILHTSIYTFMCYFTETFHRHPYCYFKGHRTNFFLTVCAEQLSTNFYVLIRIVYTFLCYSFGHVQEHPPNHLHENWRVFKRDFVS